jgi:exonuclease III
VEENITTNANTFDLNFSTQNVRSLNISTKNIITDQKILATVGLGSDIIFLSDIRLNSNKQCVACKEITKRFYLLGYRFIHNSPFSNRGVGILIKKKTMEKIQLLNTVRDFEGNHILLDIEYKSVKYTIGSVYGANTNEGINMYNILRDDILKLKNSKIILGGDWNCVWDTNRVEENLDVLNMANVPSSQRTNKIHEICNVLSLTDPYRIFYPNVREFTFTPNGLNQNNRSRLDFFLISKDLTDSVRDVVIPHCLNSSVFDHKSVSLNFSKSDNNFSFFIKDNYIEKDEFSAGVHAAVVECYLIHSKIGPDLTLDIKNEFLRKIGSVNRILLELNELKTSEITNGANNFLTLQIEGKRGEIMAIFDELPTVELLDTLDLDPDPDIFLETLILCVKNYALLEQRRCIKLKNLKKSILISEIKALKKNNFNLQNQEDIRQAELNLSNHVETELKIELQNYKKFENLNSERVTPHFMSLVKNSNKSDCPTKICDDTGEQFVSSDHLKNYVCSYFKNIYKKRNDINDNLNNEAINTFLGADILNRPEVRNAKLTEAEKVDLDSPLTIEELTKSINKANFKSAPGANGISNRFIKRFWDFFKYPLLKYANFAFQTGRLTNSFRTADIKLIPKKGGDLKKIKNWRPISLLNCFYKVISRAFAERLKKYMNKLTPCAQKGYANGRYCQEVLIGVIDTIETCKAKKIKGGLLSLDIQKAFDSLSHSYLQNIFNFYNFGPNISRWLTLLSTRRAARIIINSNISTEIFELERGNAQGDTISPFLFNLGYQILLFKLEFDVQIAGLTERVVLDPDFPPLPLHAQQVPPKVYAMADDATVLVRMERDTLIRIRDILFDFEMISGLACNVDKTTLMQFGSNEPVPAEIREIGFDLKTELTLLGLKIQSNCSRYSASKDLIEEKIRNQINFWMRFELSLPGRISIAKTFMYSQLNYLGCFLPMERERINNIETLIEGYVKGPLNISKARMTLPREEGGVGLFSVETFLSGQVCTWGKRAQTLDDHWKIRLYKNSLGSTLNLRSRFFDPSAEPILHNIATKIEDFHGKLTTKKNNIIESFFVDNPAFTYGGELPQKFDERLFGVDNFSAHRYRLGNLKLAQFLDPNNRCVNHETVVQLIGFHITNEKYDNIRRCFNTISANIVRPIALGSSVELKTFCNRFKRGSKPYRKILTDPVPDEIPRNISTYAENTQTIIGLEMGRLLNGFWGFTFFSNNMRTFLFKMHTNLLGLNNRVAHFVQDHSPICTFCRIRLLENAEDESTLHLFYECPSVEDIRNLFFRWCYNMDDAYVISRQEFFLIQRSAGTLTGTTLIKSTLAKLFQKYIWDCRNRFCLPNLDSAKEIVSQEIKTIVGISKKMRENLNDSGLANIFLQG